MKRVQVAIAFIVAVLGSFARPTQAQEAGLYIFSNANFACSYEEEGDGLYPYIVKIDPSTNEILRYFAAAQFIRTRRESMWYYRWLYQETGRAAYQRRAQAFATLVRQGRLCKQGLIHEDDSVTPPDDSPPPTDTSACEALGASTDGVTARIINGSSCTIGDSPIVRLDVFFGADQYRCTGNVIAPRVVLTASHCIAAGADRASAVDIVPGDGNTYSATGYALHPNNGTGTPGPYDLAILTLDQDLPTRVLSIVSASDSFTSGETAYIAGYGRVGIGVGGNSTSDELMAGKMRINDVTSEEIIALFDHATDGAEWANTCNGDSGGPLVVARDSSYVLAGITSYGYSEDCGPTDTSGFVNLQSSVNRQFIDTYAPDAIP
ncbi:MAG: trypsin-like serine protease [Bdellovibrionota bacterium]|nr:MAG: trypsin-like serine protease [Bdellovibrionota bacterium]